MNHHRPRARISRNSYPAIMIGRRGRCWLGISALLLACTTLTASLAVAQRTVPGDDPGAPRRAFGNDLTPGGAGSFNPTGPSTTAPLGTIPPMPPGGRGSINPTGPLPGAPSGYVPPMPPGGRGSFNPTGPIPQPGIDRAPGRPRQDVTTPRETPPTRSSGKAPVAPGLAACLKGWNPNRGLSRTDHRALCEKIWKRREPSS